MNSTAVSSLSEPVTRMTGRVGKRSLTSSSAAAPSNPGRPWSDRMISGTKSRSASSKRARVSTRSLTNSNPDLDRWRSTSAASAGTSSNNRIRKAIGATMEQYAAPHDSLRWSVSQESGLRARAHQGQHVGRLDVRAGLRDAAQASRLTGWRAPSGRELPRDIVHYCTKHHEDQTSRRAAHGGARGLPGDRRSGADGWGGGREGRVRAAPGGSPGAANFFDVPVGPFPSSGVPPWERRGSGDPPARARAGPAR